MIFEVIGTPSEEEKAFVTDSTAITYLDSFPHRKKKDLTELYPAAGEDALDLLNRILQFNPFFRISVEECLSHKFFKDMRKREREQVSKQQFVFEFEKETMTKDLMRALFV